MDPIFGTRIPLFGPGSHLDLTPDPTLQPHFSAAELQAKTKPKPTCKALETHVLSRWIMDTADDADTLPKWYDVGTEGSNYIEKKREQYN